MKTGVKRTVTGVILFITGAFVIPITVLLPIIFNDSPDDRFIVPSNVQFTVQEPGRYYLWHNYQTVFEGRTYNRSQTLPDGFEIHIRDMETGREFNFTTDTSISSTSGRSAKSSIGYIDVSRAGMLDIEITGGNSPRIFSFSRSIILKLIGMILGGAGISIVVALTGIGLIIWGVVKLIKQED